MSLHKLAKNGELNLKMLTDSELENLHKVLLLILDDLLEICEKHNLHFILIGGSAIGALRNQGFIPWDDDIDIAMPRADFEKLYDIIQKEYRDKYSMIHPQNEKNFGRILPKIRLRETEYRTILEYDLDESGVFIDIYTIENIPDDKFSRVLQGIICMFMGFALSCRRTYKGRNFFGKYENDASFKLKKAIGFFLSFASIEKWAQWVDYWYSHCKDEQSKQVGTPADDFHYFGEIYDRDTFCSYTEVEFEGRKCSLPLNYDRYLKKRYGNYMVPPAANQHDRNCYLAYDLGKYREEMPDA